MTSTSPASNQVTPQGTLPSQIALKGLLGCSAAGGAGGYPVQLAANGGLAHCRVSGPLYPPGRKP